MIHCSSTDGGMRVGRDYQAQIPPLITVAGVFFYFIKIYSFIKNTFIDLNQIESQSCMQNEHS